MNDGNSDDDLMFGWWAVAFLDLVGMKRALAAADHMPDQQNAQAVQALFAKLRQSFGAIQLFHKSATELVRPPQDTASSIASLTLEQRAEFDALTSHRIRILRWSDSVILYMPLESSEGHFPPHGVHHLLRVCAQLQLTFLAAGLPIRGGIDVGTGIEDDGQLFGPALAKAYQLESKAAGYPRVVVGPEFRTYVASLAARSGETPDARLTRTIASNMHALVRKDFDNEWSVHFLAEPCRDFSPLVATTLIPSAEIFCRDELQRHRETPDEKLSAYYAALVRYFDLHARNA